MVVEQKKPLIILTGPTAAGKTKLSIGLAKSIGGEIISADSMQVYKKMDIGTAKIRPEEMDGVPHYLVDEYGMNLTYALLNTIVKYPIPSDKINRQSGNIYIQGEVGRGKTFLINSIAKELLDRNYSVVYITSTKLFKFLNDYHWAFEDRRANLESQYEMIFDCDLLIIDDLGAETHRTTDQSNLFDVVNERMNKGLPIILSSNLDEDLIGEIYGPRVFSRILGNNSKTYEIFGEDLRLKGTDYDFS